MKILTSILLLLSLWGYSQPPIIPLPASYQRVKGTFTLSEHTRLVVEDSAFQPAARYLEKEMQRRWGLKRSQNSATKGPTLVIKAGLPAREGSYALVMNEGSVVLTASSPQGAFYGVVSFLQLATESRKVPCWNLKDSPLYGYRGFMLDESRHFFGVTKVKALLDEMAYYKLNRFHWHLTDEPGWRMEIKAYSRLALVGGVGTATDSLKPAQYYTQQQIKEIVSYAAERYITVIPEVDMPGHATAANKAYPAYSGGGSPAHPEFTFNPGKEETYTYLSAILKEVSSLFPARMIHIGGDEVSFGNEKWMKDAAITRLMKQEKLSTALEVEHYFLRRMADTLRNRQVEVLGWDEVIEAGLPVDHTLVYWWRHDHPEQLEAALRKKYRVVLCPRLPFYFDFVQDSTHRVGRRWAGAFNPLKAVYEFNAEHYPGVKDHPGQVLGLQANVWTETISTAERLDFMVFPRLLALAEACWSPRKDFKAFQRRLSGHLSQLRKQDIHYFDPINPQASPELVH
ncbi:beta-N-acetylhexosaminidase [Siphonobacter sp. SORGH_AS_0500]|uniref:beta-N-acetylhexosaminidase n=1 Tax=Siphonobacter sp. SORGH_AS_0500 TaxID=1864824 RepID=UPI002854BB3A|nr:beta-N-acetylhexosaminidase [Siphonobacter sp. SORGH_AS_0500]MDR6197136.1 hexosaminidase [Siphonobacter sp. SORGH_AS_0500]